MLRNAVLGELEVEFACLSFSEANRKREDAVLAVSEAAPLSFEFKHSMLHRSQLPAIRFEAKNAEEKLLRAQAGARYYVHFIHSLECDDTSAAFACKHNTKVLTPYKQFQSRENLKPLLDEVIHVLGPIWHGFPIPARLPDVRATLYCWVFAVEAAGRSALPRNPAKMSTSHVAIAVNET